MKKTVVLKSIILLILAMTVLAGFAAAKTRFMENLDRGVVAVRTSSSQVYIGWRMFGTEWSKNIGYHVYRNGTRVTSSPVTTSTNYLHTISTNGSYSVSAVIDGVEQAASQPVTVWDSYCRSLTLASVSGSYVPNDASVGDLDGDGQYEIVLKRLSTDISQTSIAFHLIEAYRLNGTFLWRVNLGPNNLYAPEEINPIVYDFDGDGRAEVALRTCEGNIDGTGVQIGDTDGDGKTDYRSSIATPGEEQWFMTEGPEFLSIFDGLTGSEIARTDYIERDPISQWGGSGLGQQAHRANKCMMTPAYLDGQKPSLVMCRGIYVRIKMEAWNFRNGSLSKIWSFDTANWPGYAGQGNHNLSVGDVDNDGKDEIVYASMCVDDNGSGLYTTGLGHGDALHMSDMIPTRPGLEVFQCHESYPYGTTLRDAGTGEILWQLTAGGDTGRCCAAHIDWRYPGYQMWSVASGGTYNAADKSLISANVPNWGNFLIWWDGDLQREILDAVGNDGNPIINKWGGDGAYRLLSLYNVPSSYSTLSNNGTKTNPCLSGDILGDWREECIYRSSDNTQLRIFTTTTATSSRFYTLMHDSQYRTAIAWQCNMYNQPPHPSFYIGAGMSPLPVPNIVLAGTGETIPPAAPTGLTALADGAQVRLDWADNTETDLAGYKVYRGIVSGGPYTAIAADIAASAYTDNGVVNGITYYYVVTAVDLLTNESSHSSQASAAGEPDLVAYYALENNINDSSGNGNNAIANGAPVYTTGYISQAIVLDGTDDFITLPAVVSNSNDITIAAWIYWNGGNAWQRIFDFGNDTGQYLFLSPRSGDNTLRFAIKNGGSEQIVQTTQLNTGQWIHLAVTLNGDNAVLYVNGSPAASSSTVTINPSDFNPANNYIGDSQWTDDPFFNGRIDDFRVYNFALTAAQVAVTMAGNTAPVFTGDPIDNLDAVELESYAGQSLASCANDADGINTVTFSKVSGPSWLVVAGNGILSGVPADGDIGLNTFTVKATDNGGLSDTAVMNIHVANIYSGVAGIDDLIGLASQWLMDECTDIPACDGADLDGDLDVDLEDFARFANYWLADEDLQLHLKFDETVGITAGDDSIYSRPGLLVDNPTWSTGHSGGALSFDGAGDYVHISGYKGITGTASRTCCAWVKPEAVTGEILGWGPSDTGAKWIIRVNENGTLRAEVAGGLIYGTTILTDGNWHHIAVVLADDGSPDISEARLYVDGVLETTGGVVPCPVNTGSSQDVLIGVHYALLRYYKGLIDEVRIYNRALTAAEIAALAQ